MAGKRGRERSAAEKWRDLAREAPGALLRVATAETEAVLHCLAATHQRLQSHTGADLLNAHRAVLRGERLRVPPDTSRSEVERLAAVHDSVGHSFALCAAHLGLIAERGDAKTQRQPPLGDHAVARGLIERGDGVDAETRELRQAWVEHRNEAIGYAGEAQRRLRSAMKEIVKVSRAIAVVAVRAPGSEPVVFWTSQAERVLRHAEGEALEARDAVLQMRRAVLLQFFDSWMLLSCLDARAGVFLGSRSSHATNTPPSSSLIARPHHALVPMAGKRGKEGSVPEEWRDLVRKVPDALLRVATSGLEAVLGYMASTHQWLRRRTGADLFEAHRAGLRSDLSPIPSDASRRKIVRLAAIHATVGRFLALYGWRLGLITDRRDDIDAETQGQPRVGLRAQTARLVEREGGIDAETRALWQSWLEHHAAAARHADEAQERLSYAMADLGRAHSVLFDIVGRPPGSPPVVYSTSMADRILRRAESEAVAARDAVLRMRHAVLLEFFDVRMVLSHFDARAGEQPT